MKLHSALILGLLLAASAPAELFVEHFSYSNGSLGSAGIGSSVWTNGDSPNSAISVNSAAALSHPSLTGNRQWPRLYRRDLQKESRAVCRAKQRDCLLFLSIEHPVNRRNNQSLRVPAKRKGR